MLEHAASSTDITGACQRLIRYYTGLAEKNKQDAIGGYTRLGKERAHFLQLLKDCSEYKLWEEVDKLASEISNYLNRQGYWTECQVILEMNLSAAQKLGYRKSESMCLYNLGLICLWRGEYNNALSQFEKSLRIDQQAYSVRGMSKGDLVSNAAVLNQIGETYRQQGKYKLALQYFDQSLAITRKKNYRHETANGYEIACRRGEGWTLNNLGKIACNKGDYETALQHYTQSLDIRMEVEDKLGEGITLNNIGMLYHARRDWAKALEYYEQALMSYRKAGDKPGEAATYGNIGHAYENLDDLAKAEKYISRAMQIVKSIGHPKLEEWRVGLERVRAKRRDIHKI
jgi:tetratricopeptide (TPR) repeat protein